MSNAANGSGCCACATLTASTPLAVYNRPGLAAIAYRIGTYASFHQSAIARLSDARWSALQQLRTRAADDFSIALLDAWAMVGDVLTFYQERIANEAYVQTASERLSLLELGRLIGYQLQPALATDTHLVFSVAAAPMAALEANQPLLLERGIRAQSVPGPNETPQVFETSEVFEARAAWNALSAQLSEQQALIVDPHKLYLDGANLNLSVGDLILVMIQEPEVLRSSLSRVQQIRVDFDASRTTISLASVSGSGSSSQTHAETGVWVMRTAATPFGHNAPLNRPITDGVGDPEEWELLAPDAQANKLTLSTRYDKLVAGSWVFIEQDIDSTRGWTLAKVTGVTHRSVARYGLAGSVTQLNLGTPWQLPADADLSLLRSMTVAAQNEPLSLSTAPITYPVFGSELPLGGRADGLVPGRPIAITGKRQRLRITDAAADPILELRDGGSVLLKPDDVLSLTTRPVKIVEGVNAFMTPSGFGAALSADPPPLLKLSLLDRDGQAGTLSLLADGIQLEPSAKDDPTFGEIVFLDSSPDVAVVQQRDRTILTLSVPLEHVYERASFRINANVVAATQGESVREVLGSGDATLAYQSFTLKQLPLTYVTAATSSGSASTLSVFVNEVLWLEAPSFYGHGPDERIYVLRRDDLGRTTISFGDGLTGARLPTGQNNIRAEYRKGAGLSGLVAAGQISQLLSQPLGLASVVNREAAQGGADAETRDAARTNAPLTVRTLERVVSLQDYQDFARSFAGIAKAHAVWVWNGRKRAVFITVAGPAGAELEKAGSVVTQLTAAVRASGDPHVPIDVQSVRLVSFEVHGTVRVRPEHVLSSVMSAVASTLRARFAFDAREFGQPVALSEVIAAVHAVPGVLAIDVDALFRSDGRAKTLSSRLIAEIPGMGAEGTVKPAELLVIDESSLNRLVGTP